MSKVKERLTEMMASVKVKVISQIEAIGAMESNETTGKLDIVPVETAEQRQQVEALIAELSAWDVKMSQSVGLDTDLLLGLLYNHSVAEQIAECSPPRGRMLLVAYDGAVGGCGGIRPLSAEAAEIKRLYVRPA